MKKIFTYLAFLFIILTQKFTAFSQASCPDIVITSFKIITDPLNSCLKKVSVDFVNPTNGAKSMGIKVVCGSTTVLTECHDASGQSGVQRNIVSAQFICCNLAQLNIEIAGYTGNSTCLGTPCITKLSIAGSPLPVYYKSFTATHGKSAVDLKWTTSFEQNNRGFEMQKQSAGGIWEAIAFIPTIAPSGNSTTDLSYAYSDLTSQSGITNYRIRQIDLDGKEHYSEVRTIRSISDEARKVEIFPNPGTNGKVTVLFKDTEQKYDVTLIDASGRMVKQWTDITANSLPVTNLTRGFYNLRVIAKKSGEQTVTKFIISN